jgi:hypothetical protein
MSGSNHMYIYIIHILIAAPLLIYLGLCNCKCCNEYIKKLTLILGIVVLIYHAYKLYMSLNKKEEVMNETMIDRDNRDTIKIATPEKKGSINAGQYVSNMDGYFVRHP